MTDNTPGIPTFDEFEVLARNAADDLLSERGVERNSPDPLADFAEQLGDQPHEWDLENGLLALVRSAVEADRDQRDAGSDVLLPGHIAVNASVGYAFDPADGIVTTVDEAIDHVSELLSEGVSPGEFTITTITGTVDEATDTVYFADVDGYDVGGRLLDGVMFRVELTRRGETFDVTSVTPSPEAMVYLTRIRWEKFADYIKRNAERDLEHLVSYAQKMNTTVKALFDEHAAATGRNGGDLLNET